MAPHLKADSAARAHPVPVQACAPDALAALGPLLCVHAAGDPHLLSGWSRARSVQAQVQLDSDGPSEALCFFDANGRPCWRLYLLPDSDFLAWERVLANIPVQAEPASAWRTVVRAWKHAAQPHWHACALRLHAVGELSGRDRLAAADVALSRLGRKCAQRIAGRLGRAGVDSRWEFSPGH